MDCDIVDIEAYELSKICKIKDIDFKCFKYISDTANENAGDDWSANVKKGAEMFSRWLITPEYFRRYPQDPESMNP